MNASSETNSTVTSRLFWLGVVGPLTAISIGVDGGDIFQILAVENLELDPRAIGVALGLGTLSVPLQIWAARIPLHRARHNIRIFLWLMGSMAVATGALVAFAPPGSLVAGLVLVIAILAEIAVSVLFATAWQPLISYTLSTKQRQFIIGQGRATTGLAILGSVLLFGQLDRSGRAVFLVFVGLAAFVVAWMLRVLPAAPASAEPSDLAGQPDDLRPGEVEQRAALMNIYLALPASALASWPLFVTYSALVLWPTVNLGYLGAALAVGSIGASAAWRDPGDRLITVIRSGAVVVAVCSAALAAIDGPIETDTSGAILFAILAVGSAGTAVIRIGIMELLHRRVNTENSVKVMTMVDVIGSTTFQAGFFVAGFLIAASVDSTSRLDPYQIWILATAVVMLAAIARLRPTAALPLSEF